MFKSIFTKYITTFMLITVVSFVILGSVLCSMMIQYYKGASMDQLSSTTDSAKILMEKRYEEYGGGFREFMVENKSEIGDYFEALAGYDESMSVFVTDERGNVLASLGFSSSDPIGAKVDESVIGEVRHGRYTGSGNLDGMFLHGRYIYGEPLVSEGEMVGTVFSCMKTTRISNMIKVAVKAVIMTLLWVLIAALIAVYFITDRITSPLKAMGHAAKSYASGKFDARIPVKGHDEITELAIAFNDMASSLSDLENMRSTFLSNVSHDLRTPMTTISGFIDGILDGTIPQEKQEYYLRMIGDEVRRLSRLVAALLDVSRIQAGDRKFVMSAFDICEMARVILLSFEQKIDKKKLDVEFDADNENMFVWADHDAIYQILYNICDNGVKFSRENGKYRIKITGHGKKIFVSVYNDGIGIKEEDIPHVFERFYKGDKSRGLDKTGTGLGLYIAKSIIDAHNEEIWVKSKYGEYSEFVFSLAPAAESQIKKSLAKQQSLRV